MTQLILGGVALPKTSKDKYKCYTKDLGESIRMISSRLVTEVRATIRIIEYSYDYFGDTLMRSCLSMLRSNDGLAVQYISPESDEMQSGTFYCTSLTAPTFAYSIHGEARWHNISFTLEEVEGV